MPGCAPLVLTASSLGNARAEVGQGAGPDALLREVAAAQGAPVMRSWNRGPEKARHVMRWISECIAGSTSFANAYTGTMFVNAFRIPGAFDILGAEAHRERAIGRAMAGCALHEAAHSVERQLGWKMSARDAATVPMRVVFPGLGPCCARSAVEWHASECFADAFSAAAAMAAGVSAEVVAFDIWSEAARMGDAAIREVASRDPIWSRYPLWPGIYLTSAAVALVLRRPPRLGASPAEIAACALRASRRGVLSLGEIAAAAVGDQPAWLSEFDDFGVLDGLRARLRLPPSPLPLPFRPEEAECAGESVLRLVARGCAAASPIFRRNVHDWEPLKSAAAERFRNEVLFPGGRDLHDSRAARAGNSSRPAPNPLGSVEPGADAPAERRRAAELAPVG